MLQDKPGWVSTLDNPPNNLECNEIFNSVGFLSPRGTIRSVPSREKLTPSEIGQENLEKSVLSKGSLENLQPLELPQDAVVMISPDKRNTLEPVQSNCPKDVPSLISVCEGLPDQPFNTSANRDEPLKKIASQIEDTSNTFINDPSEVKDTSVQADTLINAGNLLFKNKLYVSPYQESTRSGIKKSQKS